LEPIEREGVDFTYSPYDARLQQQVASLYGDLETLTAQVSKLRREAPLKGSEAYISSLRRELEKEEERFQREMDELGAQQTSVQEDKRTARNDGGQATNPLKLDKMREGYYQDMQETYIRGVEELSALAGVGVGKRNMNTATVSTGTSAQDEAGTRRGRSLTEAVGKVQRARTVAMEFE
jgi:hypothetical protein